MTLGNAAIDRPHNFFFLNIGKSLGVEVSALIPSM
jgi:hypothetical protein